MKLAYIIATCLLSSVLMVACNFRQDNQKSAQSTRYKNIIEERNKKAEKIPYEIALPLWLHQKWEYPEEIVDELELKGEALITLEIDREGNILRSKIKESTGNKIIRNSLEKMMKDANPAILMPSDYYPDKKDFVFAIKFSYDGKLRKLYKQY